jgi:hypothetical protein
VEVVEQLLVVVVMAQDLLLIMEGTVDLAAEAEQFILFLKLRMVQIILITVVTVVTA